MAKKKQSLTVIRKGTPDLSALTAEERKAFLLKLLAEMRKLSGTQPK